MKVRSSVKPICEKCKVIKRKGSVRIICETGLILLCISVCSNRIALFRAIEVMRLQWDTPGWV